jgi:methionyl-tRNA formyltransferase
MNLIFMGTPDFAIPSLKILFKSKHKILSVVTAPDKERGRGRKVSFSAVKEYALENNINVLQPEKLKDENIIKQLKNYNPDLFVIVAFRILPPEVFKIPKFGSFNLHASLLPKYRGAAPIQWAIINGEKETGVTTFSLEEKVDTGNIYIQEEIKIEEDDDFGTLHDKLSALGADVVLRTVDLIESGDFKLQEQISTTVTYAPKITKGTAEIDWNKNAEDIHNLVRAMSPYPGASFYYNNRMFKIYKTKVMKDKELPPGKIRQSKQELIIGCGQGSLSILEIQMEGKNKLNIADFLRGYSFNK